MQYANLLQIVKAGVDATGADAGRDLVHGLLAYAAALDIIEARAGDLEAGIVDTKKVEAAEQAAADYWHPSNTEGILAEAEAFAEGFYENA